MEALPVHKADLDHQADDIERALAMLSMPARVQGGRIGERWVRYHVVPASATRADQVLRAADAVAQAIGVEEVRVAEAGQGFALDVPRHQQRALRLLPLLHALTDLSPLTAVVGMSMKGAPQILNLNRSATWHMLARGPAGCGKSELLRTALLSLALTSRRSQVNLLGIDIGGRELAVLESLPHMLTDLATEELFAEDLLIWLVAEMDRRMALGVDRPHLVLAIDDMEPLMRACGAQLKKAAGKIIQKGIEAGVHLFAALRDLRPPYSSVLHDGDHLVLADVVSKADAGDGRSPGAFHFRSAQGVQWVDVAWLSARDLDTAARLAQAGWRASGYAPASEAVR
jgi:S-DNA-T family DNA segregation ATPase FtsK/SpoIIIE